MLYCLQIKLNINHDALKIQIIDHNGDCLWVRNNTCNISDGQSLPLAVAPIGNQFYLLGSATSRIVDIDFCAGVSNINTTNASNGYVAKYQIASTSLTATISGPSPLCSNGTYTLNSAPSGSNIFWTSSSNISINENSGLASTSGSGNGTIMATLVGSCGAITPSVKKDIWVGATIAGNHISIAGDLEVCYGNYTYWVVNHSNIPNLEYYWEIPTGWDITWQNNNYLYINAGQNIAYPQTIELFVRNQCGPGWQGPWDFEVWEDPNCIFYSVAPNPASQYIAVAENESINGSTQSSNNIRLADEKILELRLFNNQQRLVKSIQYKSPETVLSVQDLNPGHYILHIVKKDKVDQKHITITRDI